MLITIITLAAILTISRVAFARDIIEAPPHNKTGSSDKDSSLEPFTYPRFTAYEDAVKARDAKIAREKANKERLEHERRLQVRKLALAKQRAARLKAAQATAASQTSQTANVPKVYPSTCSDPKSCIYHKESGNNPNATNATGCYGIGQDCNGVLKSLCGADYACQDAFFTKYAISRYGSWSNAWAFWLNNHWW